MVRTIQKINIYYILVFCIILFILYIWVPLIKLRNRSQIKENTNYHIVCSNYKKNVDFLNDININSTVIKKNIHVPNKANEATSYLYYIITNYENLPPNIIFIHDENESWHHDGKITDRIYEWIEEYEKKGKIYYELNNKNIHKDNDLFRNNTAYQNFWKYIMNPYFGDYNKVNNGFGKCCAQFIVSKNVIQKKSKEFYQNMYDWLIEKTNGEGNGDSKDIYSGYMTSRYAEWSWGVIFS